MKAMLEAWRRFLRSMAGLVAAKTLRNVKVGG